MRSSNIIRSLLLSSACAAMLAPAASARDFDIPGGDLEHALEAYTAQTGVELIVADQQVKGVRSKGVKGDVADQVALSRILSGTGFVVHPHAGGAIGIVPQSGTPPQTRLEQVTPIRVAAAATAAGIESVSLRRRRSKGIFRPFLSRSLRYRRSNSHHARSRAVRTS